MSSFSNQTFICRGYLDVFAADWEVDTSTHTCLLHRLFSVPFFKASTEHAGDCARREIGNENDTLPRWLMGRGKNSFYHSPRATQSPRPPDWLRAPGDEAVRILFCSVQMLTNLVCASAYHVDLCRRISFWCAHVYSIFGVRMSISWRRFTNSIYTSQRTSWRSLEKRWQNYGPRFDCKSLSSISFNPRSLLEKIVTRNLEGRSIGPPPFYFRHNSSDWLEIWCI